MIAALRRLSLMNRLSLLAVLAFLAMLLIVWQSLWSLHGLLYQDRQIKTRHLVEAATGVLEHYHDLQKAGTLSEDEARQRAIEAIRRLRYESSEYFWINDLGKPVPRMVMHPTVPSLDGKVLDETRFNKAVWLQPGRNGERIPADGRNLFVTFNEVVDKAGEGYVEYLWPKPLAGGGVTSELFTKLSYVRKFEPWGWVIGSGIYIDDVDRIFREEALISLGLALVATGVLLLTTWLVRKSIVGEFGGEPRVALRVSNRIAEGDLTQEVPLKPDDRESLLYVLSHMQTSLKDMLRAIFANASRVQASIERLSAESNEINLATQVQAGAVRQTRSAITDVSASVEVVNGLVRATEEGAHEVARRARDGADVAAKVAVEMQAIASTVSVSSDQVSRLVASTGEIGNMARVIKEIADQTNLLALNAAIEAARAGEQGRGFAVVADEVRKLAERTGKATSEIGGILDGIQTDTESAVEGMKAAAPVIASGVTQAKSAADTLHAIEEQARETLEKMQALSQATRDQTRRIEDIVSNVDEVMSASGQTESVIRQSLQSAAELEQASSEMFSMVQRFRIGDVPVPIAPSRAKAPTAAKPLIEWSSALSVGHSEIDRQHQVLIEIANRLNHAMRSGAGRAACGSILEELVNYTVSHFGFEEKLMDKHGYTDREAHLAAHRKLIDEVSRFRRQYESGGAISVELMGFIRDWLVNHILKVDRALVRDLAARGVS
ncbi:bacteriohemerythrin [Accumulibacter sp.]|uniref:bacteriohemerythrin n=1 Tax=Accumulibacter sp. TaxID=2053492 RepID=UPI0025FEECDE|nr:bacteriohemerythrin [Accumulibacter sp.]MCM8625227.1 bacteriohemerythrin [Accumulibacter sp.]